MKHYWSNQTQSRRSRGFTLAELVVVSAIIVILSAVLIVNIRGGERRQLLRRASQALAQDIRALQQRALAAQEVAPGVCGAQAVVPGGFGINASTGRNDEYVLFADCNGNGTFNGGPGGDGVLETRTLSSIVAIDGLLVDENRYTQITVVFLPPDPEVSIIPSGTSASVRLILEGGSCPDDCRTVSVNRFGNVEITP